MLKIISKIWGRRGSCQGCVTTLHHYSIYDFHSATAFMRSRRLNASWLSLRLFLTREGGMVVFDRGSSSASASLTHQERLCFLCVSQTSVLSYIQPQKPKDYPIKYDFSCSWAKKGQWCLRKGQGSPSSSRGSIPLISSFIFAAVDSQFVIIFTLHWAQFI